MLLVPQRVDRIELRVALGGPDAKRYSYKRAKSESRYRRLGCDYGLPSGKLRQQRCRRRPEGKTQQTTEQTKRRRLYEELQQYIASRCAERFANSDFASSFSHGYEHDIHDANTTDKKTYTRYSSQEISEYFSCLLTGFNELLAIDNGKIIIRTGLNFVFAT